MRVYKRGSVYWFELVFNGQRHQKSTKVKNHRVASQIASAYHTALAKGEVGILEREPAPTFGIAMKDFLSWSTLEHQAHPSTTERYSYSSKPLIAYFGNVNLAEITPDDADAYKQKRSKDKTKGKKPKLLRPATVNRELACLRAMFNHTMKRHPELRNPISKTSGVKLLEENNMQDRVLSYSEEAKYLAKATPTLVDVATIILEQGMRPEEVFGLEARTVDLEHGYLRILRGKTPAARRRIELTSKSSDILKRRIAQHPTGYLFPCEVDSSRPIESVQGAHERALKESKVAHFRPYDLRHTFATRAAEAGIDLVTLAAMLGHSRIQMVLRYAHPTQGHQALAMEKVNAHKEQQREIERRKQEQAEGVVAGRGLRLVKKTA